MQHLKARAPAADAAEGVSGFANGFDARPWLSRLDPASAQLFCAVFEAGYLRGADAWHLATALYLTPDPGELTFLTLDERQGDIASKLGFAR